MELSIEWNYPQRETQQVNSVGIQEKIPKC